MQGLLGARFVVAVDTHLTASSRPADVVLPAATWAERRGTFTNLEDRITWLSQLVTARGVAWPDWMIASELAARLGVDLGFSSLDDIWDEIDRVSPLHQGRRPTRSCYGDAARDGVLVRPSDRTPARPASPRPLDPDGRPRHLLGGAAHRGADRHAPRRGVDRRPSPTAPARPAAAALASTGGPAAPTVAAAGQPSRSASRRRCRPCSASPAGGAGRRRRPRPAASPARSAW